MELLYRGTRFSFETSNSSDHFRLECILAECFEEGFVFQIIALNGYNAGSICGYVKDSESLLKEGHKATTGDNLTREINRNFLEVDQSSISIAPGRC